MSLEQQLSDSIAIIAENKKLRALVERQRSAIALLHARLSIADIKLARARQDEQEAFHRKQA